MGAEPQRQPYPKDFTAHILRIIDPVVDGDQVTDKDFVDAAIASAMTGLHWQEAVLDRFDPTGGLPADVAGNRYISTATANGWTVDNIYEGTGGSGFDETVPTEGYCLTVEDEDAVYYYNDAANWVKFGNIIDHANLSNVLADQHHVKSHAHNGADGSGTVAHSDTTGQGADDHHDEDIISRAPKTYYVSQDNGSDSAPNDGSLFKPYATITKAVTIGEAAHTRFIIMADPGDYRSETPTITKDVAISGWGGSFGTFTLSPLTFTINGGRLSLDDLYLAEGFAAGDGGSAGKIYIENCFWASISGGITVTSDCYIIGTVGTAVPSSHFPAGWVGNYHEIGSGQHLSAGMGAALDMNTKKITALGDPSAAQDAATKNYHDTAGPTVNEKAGAVAPASFVGPGSRSATVTFSTAMPDNNYAISIMGEDQRSWSLSGKTANGFTIDSNSAVAMAGNTLWIVRENNDP
jgi:hypothetical protein